MKAIFYGANFVLLVLVLSLVTQLKSLKSPETSSELAPIVSGDPEVEAFKKPKKRVVSYSVIPLKSIFHKDRKMPPKEEPKVNELLKQMNSKVYLLRGIVKVGEKVAIISVLDKDQAESKSFLEKNRDKVSGDIYRVGQTLNNSLYKLKSIHLGENPYVTLSFNGKEKQVYQFAAQNRVLNESIRSEAIKTKRSSKTQNKSNKAKAITLITPEEIEEIRRKHNALGK